MLHPCFLITAATASMALWLQPASAPPPAVAPADSTPKATQTQIALPFTWHGTWRGQSTATAANRPTMEFTMQLRVGPVQDKPDRVTWEITYEGPAGNQVRPYELIAIDAASPTRFVIDEKNGIMIDAGLIGTTIATHFTVQAAMITANYRLEPGDPDATPARPDRIIVELTTFKSDDARTSGGRDGIPEVKSWKVAAVQRAELVRQK